MNDRLVLAFSTVLFLPILFDFITAITGGNSIVYTFLLYVGSFVVFFVEFHSIIRLQNILTLLCLYLIFFLNYVSFPDSQTYMSSIGFVLVCLYFLPIGVLFFSQIRDWKLLVSITSRYAIFAFAIGLYIIFFTNISRASSEVSLFTYMEFSYAQLPFICATFARYYETKNKLTLMLFLLGFFEILSYGCRGSIIFTFIFVSLLMLLNGKSNRVMLFLFGIVGLLIYSNFEIIVNYLLTIDLFSDSYFLQHLVKGEMFESSRSEIYEACEKRIVSMGTEISGLFGDRAYCPDVYPHNICLEVMMQFGWIFGPMILLGYLILIISCWFKKDCRIVLLLILCSLLFKYILSGSYLMSGLFWVATFALISIRKTKNMPY